MPKTATELILGSDMFNVATDEEAVDMLCDIVDIVFSPGLPIKGLGSAHRDAIAAICRLISLIELSDHQREKLVEYLRNDD